MTNNPSFYILDHGNGKNSKYFAGGQYYSRERKKCPRCNAFLELHRDNLQVDIQLNHLGRLGFAPFLWNSHSLTIIREDVLNVWKDSGVTGFELGNVSIKSWYENESKLLPFNIPVYKLVIPINKVKLLEPPVNGDPCPICGYQKYKFPQEGIRLSRGLQIQNENWNGSDVIGIDRYGYILYTEKVVIATLKAGFGDYLPFVKADKFLTWKEYNYQKWKPKEYAQYIEGFLIRNLKDIDK